MTEYTNTQMKSAEEFVYQTYKNDRNTYDRAIKLQKELGLGGLWRGVYPTLKAIIKTLQAERLACDEKAFVGGK